jgi:hypothetical protein
MKRTLEAVGHSIRLAFANDCSHGMQTLNATVVDELTTGTLPKGVRSSVLFVKTVVVKVPVIWGPSLGATLARA